MCEGDLRAVSNAVKVPCFCTLLQRGLNMSVPSFGLERLLDA